MCVPHLSFHLSVPTGLRNRCILIASSPVSASPLLPFVDDYSVKTEPCASRPHSTLCYIPCHIGSGSVRDIWPYKPIRCIHPYPSAVHPTVGCIQPTIHRKRNRRWSALPPRCHLSCTVGCAVKSAIQCGPFVWFWRSGPRPCCGISSPRAQCFPRPVHWDRDGCSICDGSCHAAILLAYLCGHWHSQTLAGSWIHDRPEICRVSGLWSLRRLRFAVSRAPIEASRSHTNQDIGRSPCC